MSDFIDTLFGLHLENEKIRDMYCQKCYKRINADEVDQHTVTCWGQLTFGPGERPVTRYQTFRPNNFEPSSLIGQTNGNNIHTLTCVFERYSSPLLDYIETLEVKQLPLFFVLMAPRVDLVMNAYLNSTNDMTVLHTLRIMFGVRDRVRQAVENKEACPLCLDTIDRQSEIYVYTHQNGDLCGETVHFVCSACCHFAMRNEFEPPMARRFTLTRCVSCTVNTGIYQPMALRLRL